MSDAVTPPAENDALTRRVLKVCDGVGQFIEYWGFKAIHGRIWTLLALHAEPMSQSDIARTLHVSRSLVSTAVAELVEYGVLRAVGEHRNAPYKAVLDVWPTITDVLRAREWMLLESTRQSLEAAREEAEDAEARGEQPRFDPSRIRLLLGMTELAQTMLRMLISLRTPRGTEKFSRWLQAAMGFAKKMQRLRPTG
jgi:DNA-binding transcriptional regulator GbsR (MarR family)